MQAEMAAFTSLDKESVRKSSQPSQLAAVFSGSKGLHMYAIYGDIPINLSAVLS